MECAGAFVVFDGPDSPVTQSFGLGVSEELTPAVLDSVERFFRGRGAPVHLEISPFAGISALDLLASRNYRPIEISSVLCRELADSPPPANPDIVIRNTGPEEAALWNQISTRAWVHDYPEYAEFFQRNSAVVAAREHSVCFLAEYRGEPAAAGALCLHEGVALFAGAGTVPHLRRRGLQNALLEARLRFAFERGCDLAMMVAEIGSRSQRNAERQGFRIVYTRTKWRLSV
jgi:GNAT superfamily N-acetyltransferase